MLISLYTLPHPFYVAQGACLAFFFLRAHLNVVFVVLCLLLCRTSLLLFLPPMKPVYLHIQSSINENVNNLPVVEVTRLVTIRTTLSHLCCLYFISTL